MIPFYKPFIDQDIEQAVLDAMRSGWLSSGPLVRELEKAISNYTGASKVVCTGSAGMSLQMVLKWFGITHGDEVILPAFTHPATANAIVLCGAIPVFADIDSYSMTIDAESIASKITTKTKCIIPVDMAGLPCDYSSIFQIVAENQHLFHPNSSEQETLGRILILADASHSFGAKIGNHISGSLADISVFSFHAVKNLTSGEGAAICIHLPSDISNLEVTSYLKSARVHGLNADAYTKLQNQTWEYDVVLPSFKSVMTDIQAAIALSLLAKYDRIILPRRFELHKTYQLLFANEKRLQLPLFEVQERKSCGHLYIVRIANSSKSERNAIMRTLYDEGIITNLQFVPIPLLTYYKKEGYKTNDLANTMQVYEGCISLPFFHSISIDEMSTVARSLSKLI